MIPHMLDAAIEEYNLKYNKEKKSGYDFQS